MKPELAKQTIIADFPEFKGSSFQVLHNRHSIVLEASKNNESFIFKFALTPQNYDILKEIELLKHFTDKLPVNIPQVCYIGKMFPYFGYPKIQSNQLTEDTFLKLPQAVQDHILEQISTFLQSIHNQKNKPQPHLIMHDPSSQYSANILESCKQNPHEADLQRFSERIVEAFQIWEAEQISTKHFVYNDLHFANLLIDEHYNLTVLDFGFCAEGYPHRDFHQFHKYQAPLLSHLLERYTQKTGREVDIKGIELTSKIDQLNYYFTLHKNSKTEYLEAVKAPILKWMKEGH